MISITALILFAAIARFMASNIWIEPTEMPWMLTRRTMIGSGSSSFAEPEPIMLILPPTRIAPNATCRPRC